MLKNEGKNIAVKLNTGGDACEFITDNVIDRGKLEDCFENELPEDWKKDMNIRQNFCIYLTDQSGRVISVKNRTGFGIDELNLSGTPCSQKVP